MNNKQWNNLLDVIDGKKPNTLPTGFIIDSPWLPGWYGISTLDYYTSDTLWFEANKKAIQACVPGALFTEPHEAAVRVMVDGLLGLKLLEGDAREIIEKERYRGFCPHNTSHWLGSDVHDVGDYRVDGAWRPLEPGMVLTVEPGIYIPQHASTAHLARRWIGLGIRIEDDVLITSEGAEVLSADAPKERRDIESLMTAA